MLSTSELKAWLAPTRYGAVPGIDMCLPDLEVEMGRSQDVTFVVALLQDIHYDDEAVLQWLTEPRDEFGGVPAKALIERGHVQRVEAFLVEIWNTTARAPGVATALIEP
jgi:hypothetical protein